MERRRLISGALAGVLATPWVSRLANASSAELLIGQSSILSGPTGALMKLINAGAQMVFDEVNAGGGIGGRTIRLEALDDGLNPERAVKNYQELADKRVVSMFSCVGSPTTLAAEPILRKSGVPLVGALNVADSVRKAVQGIGYFVRAGYGREVEAIVQHLSITGIQDIGLAYTDNSGGKEVLSAFRASLAAGSGREVGVASVRLDGSDAEAAGKRIGQANPQAVIVFCPGIIPANVIGGVWSTGAKCSFYGMSLVDPRTMFDRLGPRSKGLVISQVLPFTGAVNPHLAKFRQLAQSNNIAPEYRALEGFLNATVLVDALRRASSSTSPASINQSLQQTRLRFGDMQVSFSGVDALGSKYVDLTMIGDGGRIVR